MKMRGDDYKFLQIADAVNSINQKVNLIGTVIETSLPKNTQGTDCFCSVRIIDESRQNLGVYVHFFAESMDKLPSVNSVGDILLVTHVVMKSQKNRGVEVYAQYNKKLSTFAIFEGRDLRSHDCVPYVWSGKYNICEKDKKLVTEMRKWLSVNKIEGLNDSFPLKDINEGDGSNLLCKILHVHEVQKDSWVLLVWDGTDTPPVPVETRLEDEMENSLPIQVPPLARDVLCKLPAVGTVIRMNIDQSSKKIGLNFIHTNRWVKFVGIKFEVRAALWNAVLMPFSKLCYLHDDDDRVLERERLYNDRLESKWGRMPDSTFPWPTEITETDHPDVPFVTLMNVLTHPEVTGKFRCVVRVVAMLPCAPDDFCTDSGIYRVRLTLEDPTARIHAFLYRDDVIKFFGDDQSTDELMRKRDILLGIDGGSKRNPPWVQCCLKSYCVDKSDEWGTRNYRIFDTTLVESESDPELDSADGTRYECPDSEFHDFEKDRDANLFKAGQIWACYDDSDGMPRFYAKLTKASSFPFKVSYKWLEAVPISEAFEDWINELPVGCGNFKLGAKVHKTCERFTFSHKMVSFLPVKKRASLLLHPKEGEIWAIIKDWDITWMSSPENHTDLKYEIVKVISDFVDGAGLMVCHLDKVAGFVSLFQSTNKNKSNRFWIRPDELYKFSHLVPSSKMSGSDRDGVPIGSYELDPAALPLNPVDLYFPGKVNKESEKMDSKVRCPPSKSAVDEKDKSDKVKSTSNQNSSKLEIKKKETASLEVNDDKGDKQAKSGGETSAVSENGVETTQVESESDPELDSADGTTRYECPDPEFHDFEKDRDANLFKAGQIWACYDDSDGMPRFYAKLTKASSFPFEVSYKWLEAVPISEAFEDWINELPVGCGNFKLGAKVHKTCERFTFSHKMVSFLPDKKRGSLLLHPKEGEIWAIIKDWDITWMSSPENHTDLKYEIVKVISDFVDRAGLMVCHLDKVAGFVSLFQSTNKNKSNSFWIRPDELYKFSHLVPSSKMSGSDRDGVPIGSYELDPAALPLNPDDLYFPGKVNKESEKMDSKVRCPPSKSAVDEKDKSDKVKSTSNQNSSKLEIKKKETASLEVNDDKGDKQAKSGGETSAVSENGVETTQVESESDPELDSADGTIRYECPDSEFHDFEKDRDANLFKTGQIWACYDDSDGMPRFYAKLTKASSFLFEVSYKWLEAVPISEAFEDWINELPVGCGNFKLGAKVHKTCELFTFSHKMVNFLPVKKRGSLLLHPKEGEIWAIIKDWDITWMPSPENHTDLKYEIVKVMSGFVDGAGLKVCHLDKVAGFVSLFQSTNKNKSNSFWIRPDELYKFSHLVPSSKMSGSERDGVPIGSYELDPAALPLNPDDLYFPGKVNKESEKMDSKVRCPPSKSAVDEKDKSDKVKSTSNQNGVVDLDDSD